MRRYFWPLLLASVLVAVTPIDALACPKHTTTPCSQSQPRPLPPAAISVEVIETVSVIVYDYECIWEWDERTQAWVRRRVLVGWHTEYREQKRWVTAYWNEPVGAFTYIDRSGAVQIVKR